MFPNMVSLFPINHLPVGVVLSTRFDLYIHAALKQSHHFCT